MSKNREEIEKELVKAKSVDEVKSILAENNESISDEEAKALYKQIEEEGDIFAKEVSAEELEAVSGGAFGFDRDYETQGCAATVEEGSMCWSNDACGTFSIRYKHMPRKKCQSLDIV